jgi:hypothetical protein
MQFGSKETTLYDFQNIIQMKQVQKTWIKNLWPVLSSKSLLAVINRKWCTDEAKRENITEHSNINEPSQYKSKYQELILKHFNIVSIGKNNLGRVKDFFHKIHLKDQ